MGITQIKRRTVAVGWWRSSIWVSQAVCENRIFQKLLSTMKYENGEKFAQKRVNTQLKLRRTMRSRVHDHLLDKETQIPSFDEDCNFNIATERSRNHTRTIEH